MHGIAAISLAAVQSGARAWFWAIVQMSTMPISSVSCDVLTCALAFVLLIWFCTKFEGLSVSFSPFLVTLTLVF